MINFHIRWNVTPLLRKDALKWTFLKLFFIILRNCAVGIINMSCFWTRNILGRTILSHVGFSTQVFCSLPQILMGKILLKCPDSIWMSALLCVFLVYNVKIWSDLFLKWMSMKDSNNATAYKWSQFVNIIIICMLT